MLIDWFTVLAQIINFLLLVFLLKKFLYKPILEGIDKRKKEIETSIQQATKKEREAKTVLEEYQQKKTDLENNTKKILEDASHKAHELLKRKSKEVNDEIDELKKVRLQKIRQEEKEFKEYTIDQFRKIIIDVCRKVMGELSDRKIDDVVFDKFLKYLREELPLIKEEIKDQKNVKLVTSRELTIERKKQFQEIIEGINFSPNYQYLVEENNILGVNLLIDGYELSWNAAGSLGIIEEKITHSLDQAEFLR